MIKLKHIASSLLVVGLLFVSSHATKASESLNFSEYLNVSDAFNSCISITDKTSYAETQKCYTDESLRLAQGTRAISTNFTKTSKSVEHLDYLASVVESFRIYVSVKCSYGKKFIRSFDGIWADEQCWINELLSFNRDLDRQRVTSLQLP